MKTTILERGVAAAGLALLTAAFAPDARACSVDSYGNAAASGWLQQQRSWDGEPSHDHDRDHDHGNWSDRTIVGLWKFTFTSEGTTGIPDGTVLDSGFATWHRDGTELMNSSRPPQSSNFCMGVWEQEGKVYKLNHFGLSWDPTGTTFVGPANIRETVVVDHSGDRYFGTFTIDQYAEDGTTLLMHLQGTVEASRVTVD